MKKLVLILCVLVLALSFVMATWGQVVEDYSAVTNPEWALGYNSNYSLLEYSYDIDCPEGGFYRYPGAPSIFCQHNSSGVIISGWEVISFGEVIENASLVSIDVANGFDDCVFPYCNITGVRVFATSELDGYKTDWDFLGAKNLGYSERAFVNFTVSQDIEAVAIARFAGGDARPDARLYSVNVF